MPGVIEVAQYIKAGQSIGRFGDFRDRIGHVIAVGSNPEEAAHFAENALRSLTVQVCQTTNRGFTK